MIITRHSAPQPLRLVLLMLFLLFGLTRLQRVWRPLGQSPRELNPLLRESTQRDAGDGT
jgi:hypothetical protein